MICPYLELYQYLYRKDEKQDLILKVFDYFEAESKLLLGESEINISCMLGFW